MIALTEHEEQVLPFIAAGIRPEKIGAQIGIAATTVEQYAQKIRGKAGVHDRLNLMLWFVRRQCRALDCPASMVADALLTLRRAQ